MASKNSVSAPPPTPLPTPVPAPVDETNNGDVMGVTLGTDGPGGTAARDESAPTGKTGEGEPVQPEVGGEPIVQSSGRDVTQPMPDHEGTFEPEGGDDLAEQAFATLAAQPFDPSTNLGDWDGDGVAGGSVPTPPEDKPAAEKTNVELGEELGKAHAKQGNKPSREQMKTYLDGKLPNGKALDDEFWTAYDQAFDRELEQLAVDELSDEDRIVRIERTLGLPIPRG